MITVLSWLLLVASIMLLVVMYVRVLDLEDRIVYIEETQRHTTQWLMRLLEMKK